VNGENNPNGPNNKCENTHRKKCTDGSPVSYLNNNGTKRESTTPQITTRELKIERGTRGRMRSHIILGKSNFIKQREAPQKLVGYRHTRAKQYNEGGSTSI
jgi:hypothetical protein